MAQKVTVALEDDLTGEEAQETVNFALDGKSYEIDLSYAHSSELRSTLNRYVLVARKAGRGGKSSASRTAGDREQLAAIREWARGQGLPVADRGRIPAGVVERYHAEA